MTFWTNQRVVVTGGAGMLGIALVGLLRDAGAEVCVLDDFSRGRQQLDGVSYLKADAGRADDCAVLFDGAFAVINLAAFVAGVTYNQTHQAEMFEANIRLQAVPAMVAAKLGVPHFLQVSSVCVYGEEYQNPCLEENGWKGEPTDANSGYAWAKRMGERATRWANLQHAVIVRPANMYGIGDYFGERAHVIPALIERCLADEVIRVHGTGKEVREFLEVSDAARACLVALERGEDGQVYNIGTNGVTATTICQLVMLIQHLTGTEHKRVEFTGGEAGDAARWVRADKLNALGWQPAVGLQEGLERVIHWYQNRGK